MDTKSPSPQMIEAAGSIVAEYAMIAFQEQFLHWTKDVNQELAEFIWNCGGIGLDQCRFTVPGPPVDDLVRTLSRARRTRWADEDFVIFDLQSELRAGEIVLTFSVSWDECRSLHPIEMTVEMPLASPTERN